MTRKPTGTKEMELDLCLKCKEDLVADGRVVRLSYGGIDRKAKCGVCGRMRYSSRYAVSKAVKK